MTDRNRHSIWPMFVAAVLAPVLYILSIGPFFWVVVWLKSTNLGEFAQYVNFPIFWASRQWEVVGNVLRLYVYFWIDSADKLH